MGINGEMKNKALFLLSCGVDDNGKILSINNEGNLEAMELPQANNKIVLSSATIDYTNYRKDITLPVEPITKDNFYNYNFVFIYDNAKEYKQGLYLPFEIGLYREDYLFYSYYGIDKYFHIIEYNGNYYYNFTSAYSYDTSLLSNLIFNKAVENG